MKLGALEGSDQINFLELGLGGLAVPLLVPVVVGVGEVFVRALSSFRENKILGAVRE